MVRSLVLLFLLTASFAYAQNIDNPLRPYDGDTATILLYHFDEDNGAVEPNEGPRALFGNITGGRWVPDGRFGGGLAMDGNTQIDPARTLLFTSDDLTMEVWVYQTERPGAVFLMDTTKYDEIGTHGRLLGIGFEGQPFAFAIRGGGAQPRLAVAPFALPLNEWVHLAGLWSESRGLVEIAVNGHTVGRDFLDQDAEGTDRITIGRSQSIPDPRGFIGKIDEVRVSAERRFLQPVALESKSWGAIKALY